MISTAEKAQQWAAEAERLDNILEKSTAADMAGVYATLLVAERLEALTAAVTVGSRS
jgi:hypothetical protein